MGSSKLRKNDTVPKAPRVIQMKKRPIPSAASDGNIAPVRWPRRNNLGIGGIMKTIATPDAPAAIGPYAQGNIVNGLLFASGQIALDPATGALVGATIEEQTAQVMKNIGALLAAAGTDFGHVVKTTCFLNDMDDFAAFNAEYGKSFTGALPARSAVAVEKLPKDALVEVEVIAEVR